MTALSWWKPGKDQLHRSIRITQRGTHYRLQVALPYRAKFTQPRPQCSRASLQSNSKRKCRGKPEARIDKHYGNQHAKFLNQGPDQQTTHGQINGQDHEYDAEQLSSSQPKTSRHETSLTSTDTRFVTLASVASLSSSQGTWLINQITKLKAES